MAARCRRTGWEVAPLAQRDGDGIERIHPQDTQYAVQGGVGADREHEEDHQRLQVASADPHQRARAAARGEDHADAEEEQPADEMRQPGNEAVR